MAIKYSKLTKANCAKLQQNEMIVENGIVYQKTKNNDGKFSINICVNGKRIHRVIGYESDGTTRVQVEEVIAQIKSDAKNNRLNLPQNRKTHLKFYEASKIYIECLKSTNGKSVEKKEQQLRMYLVPFFKNYIVSQISTFDIEKYKHERSKTNISKSTINREIQTLSHMLNCLVEWGKIPFKSCKIKKFKENNARITYLTQEQCNRILEIASRYPNPYIYPFILIGLETAMRRSEILSIELKNIHLDRKMIYIPQAKAGEREQPITNNLVHFLEKYIPMIDSSQPYLFPSKNSKSGHLEWIDKAFRAVIKEAGLDPKVIVRHTLRHTAITHLVQAGVDLPTVQRISGHKTIQMVIRYSHQNGAHIEAAMDKLENSYKNICERTLKAI